MKTIKVGYCAKLLNSLSAYKGTRIFSIIIFSFLISLLVSNKSYALDFEVSKLETKDLKLLYFDPMQTYLTPHAVSTFSNSLEFQRKIFNWKPYEPTTVFLKDFTDYGNASATSVPVNRLTFDIAPLSKTFETVSASERLYLLMNHELTHVATMDMWGEEEQSWREFFSGKPIPNIDHPLSILYTYLASPRIAVPRWYLEGSAVFMETWMAGGLGRAMGAYDEMVFRSMVNEEAYFYDPLGLVSEGSKIDFQVGVNTYLYGTRFMSYLAYTFSPYHVVRWLRRDVDSEAYYADQFEHVFSSSLDAVWQDWINWERDFQNNNLKRLKTYTPTPYKSISDRALGSISRGFIDSQSNQIIAGFRYPGVVAHLGKLSLKDGEIDALIDIKGPMLYRVTSLAYDEKRRQLFYTEDHGAYRDIKRLDLTGGESEMLVKDARIGELAFNPSDNSLWGIRHLNGLATIVRLEAPYTKWSQVHTFDYGTVLFDMDISQDGQYLSASMGKIDSNHSLVVFKIAELLTGTVQPYRESKFGLSVPEGFVFTKDGKYLYGSSYYTGVSNIIRYEVATDDVQFVSNSITGFFRPLPKDDGKLIVLRYTAKGFVPVEIDPVPIEDIESVKFLGTEIAKKHPIVRQWQVKSPASANVEELITAKGLYEPTEQMQLLASYPIVEGYKDAVAAGYHFTLADPMTFNTLDISVSVSNDNSLNSNENLHLDIKYKTLDWELRYWHNDADFYDLFGPTKRGRKGDALMIGYDSSIIYDPPMRLDFYADLAYYSGLDTLPGAQNVDTISDELMSAEIGLTYSNTRHSLGHVDEEKGYLWNLVATSDHASGQTVNKIRGDFDFGFALPLKHSSVWLRNSAGISDGEDSNPYSKFYFGGFGNNYVDKASVKRYRQFYSLPGFDINEISSDNYYRSTLEWNLPPVRFKKVGSPGFYLTHMRPAVFASTLQANNGFGGIDEQYSNIGAQVDFKFMIMHRLSMTLSIGYAKGYIGGRSGDDEWMVSLKIL